MLAAEFTASSDLDFQRSFESVNLWNLGSPGVTLFDDLLQKTELPVTETVLSGKPKNLPPKTEVCLSLLSSEQMSPEKNTYPTRSSSL